jgi:hypothetical protein
MSQQRIVISITALVAFVVILGFLCSVDRGSPVIAADAAKPEPTVAQLRDEIEHLKQLLPDQAHAMHDVSYHFTNLWFAGQQENWPLAQFYLGETKSHLQWAVRLKPKRKDSQDREIDLVAILQAVENTPLKQLAEALAAQDRGQFEKAYRATLEEGCYICHKAADKPYLRPQVPTQPEAQIINFDPQAAWPK